MSEAIWRIEQWLIEAKEAYQGKIKPTTHIEELNITTRCLRTLQRVGIRTIEDLFNYDPEKLSELRGFGVRSARDLIDNGLKSQAEDNDWEKRALEAEKHIETALKVLSKHINSCNCSTDTHLCGHIDDYTRGLSDMARFAFDLLVEFGEVEEDGG